MGQPEVQIPITTLLVKEINFRGSFRYGVSLCQSPFPTAFLTHPTPPQPGDYPLAIALVSQGKIDLKPLVTHRFSFDQAVEAFQVTRNGKSADGKAVIKAVISGPDVSPDDLS